MRQIRLDIMGKLFTSPLPEKLEDLLDVRDYNRRTEPLLQSLAEIELGVVEKVHPYKTKWYDYIWAGLLMIAMAVPAFLFPYAGTHLLVAGIDIYLIRLVYRDVTRKMRNGGVYSTWRNRINREISPKLLHVRWTGGDMMAAWRGSAERHFDWLRAVEEARQLSAAMPQAQRDDSLDAIAYGLGRQSPTPNPGFLLGQLAALGLGSIYRGKE